MDGPKQSSPISFEPNASALFCRDLPTRPLLGADKVLVSGASGYIGGRLVPELVARNYQVRTMVRADAGVSEARWPEVEAVAADALDPESLRKAFAGCVLSKRTSRNAWCLRACKKSARDSKSRRKR